MSISRYPYALVAALMLGACSSTPTESGINAKINYATASSNPFIENNYKAADALVQQLNGRINPAQTMIIATLVNIDELSSSSTFGRLASEQISSRFSQTGYSMIEMKFRDYVYMKQDQGELLLTREIKDVAKNHNAQAVIAGTYAMSSDMVFVNLKVIQPSSNVVLAVHDYAFPLDSNLRAMTKNIRK